jgi:hypothetical protein
MPGGYWWCVPAVLLSVACGGLPNERCGPAVGRGYPPAPALDGFQTFVAGQVHLHARNGANATQADADAFEQHRLYVRDQLGSVYLVPDGAEVHYFLYGSPEDKARSYSCGGTSPVTITGQDGRYEVHHAALSLHELVHVYTLREPDRTWTQLITEGLPVYLGDYYAFSREMAHRSEVASFFERERELASVSEKGVGLLTLHQWTFNKELSEDERVARYISAGSQRRFLRALALRDRRAREADSGAQPIHR